MTKSNKSALFFCRIFSALHSIEKVVKNKIIRTIFGAGLIAIASSASAEDSGRSVWEAIVDTLPAGMVSEENSSGSYLSDTWVGMKTIIRRVLPDCSFPPTRFIRDMHTKLKNATTKTVTRGAAVFRATYRQPRKPQNHVRHGVLRFPQ